MAATLRGENEYLDLLAEDWVRREARLESNGDILISISPFMKLPQAVRNRITRHLLMKIRKSLRRIDRGHIQSVCRLACSDRPQGTLDLPNGLMVKRIYDRLLFTAGLEEKPNDFHYLLHGPGTFRLDQIGRTISLVEMERGVDLNLEDSPWTVYLDADKVRYPLVTRNFRPGDRFVPLGMSGHKKIKDFFMDLKIPSEARAAIPILISKETPVWVCGYRMDERFKVTRDTKKILKVTVSW